MMKSGQFLLLLTVLTVLFLSGCAEVTGGFEEYAGVNLINGHVFDPLVNTDWQLSNASGFYINFTDRSAVADTGLSADAIAAADQSGLSIPNLVPVGNAGDFENGSIAADWTTNGNTVLLDSSSTITDTYCIDYSVDDADTMITYDLITLTDFDTTASYRFLFSYKMQASSGTSLYFEVNDGTSRLSDRWTIEPPDTANSYRFPYDSGTASSVVSGFSGSPVFAIGSISGSSSVNTQAGYLDDFRVVRTDVSATGLLDKSIYFDVPLTEAGRLPLVSGTYRFSVWIMNEEASLVTPTVANTFPSTGVTLRMESLSQSGHTALFTADSSWSSWQQISVTGSLEVDSTTDPSIRLSIMPTLYNDQDCGIMLIAYPQLMFIP